MEQREVTNGRMVVVVGNPFSSSMLWHFTFCLEEVKLTLLVNGFSKTNVLGPTQIFKQNPCKVPPTLHKTQASENNSQTQNNIKG